jgi:hypothetical protein
MRAGYRWWRLVAAFAVSAIACLFAWPPPGNARDTSVLTHNPYPCSVLSPYPCHPTFCSVFSRHPCQPDINYGFGQDLRLTIASRTPVQAAPSAPAPGEKTEPPPERRLDTIRDMFAALRACWVPPAADAARPGTQLSVRLSFKRNGEPVGAPRVTFVSPGTPADVKQTYLDAVTAALKRCTPLPLSPRLGGALAGRPIAIRFIDDRP